MDTQFHCQQGNRVEDVRAQKKLNGIEYLEVATPDQLQLRVVFVHPLPGMGDVNEVPPGGAQLTPANFAIEGGVRIKNIVVTAVAIAGREVTLTVNAAGDFSYYTLRIVTSDLSSALPPGYDPRLSAVEFNFKAGCASEFDCKEENICPPAELKEPTLNYLAKDYATFRRLMLDRLGTLMPDWTDRTPADPLVTMVEALAYRADQLSYWQDAIATEAYLGTARSRISLRRHARLLDYRMHDGCNARTWVQLEVSAGAAGKTVRAGTPVLTCGGDGQVVIADDAALGEALRAGPIVFQTLHDLELDPAQNKISFYTWSDGQCCLPRGATRATLHNDPALTLAPGDWLLFEEIVSPTTGLAADVELSHRQVVRLIRADATTDPLNDTPILEVEWATADALTFPLCLSVRLPDAIDDTEVGIARGNLVLADHGFWTAEETVVLDDLAEDRPPRGSLSQAGLTVAVPFDANLFSEEGKAIALPSTQRSVTSFLTASAALATAPNEAVPVVQLDVAGERWQIQRDLLASDRFAQEFVVEIENDGTARLRFGDGLHGLRPSTDATITALYRLGSGRVGNVGAEALGRIRSDITGILSVRNPVPARGGVDLESMEAVRQYAPQAFRRQERAVTTDDWVEVAERHPEVQRAAARFRWTGSWYTVFVTVDREGGRSVTDDPDFIADFRAHLEKFRLAGYDLEINGPVFVPLDVKMDVCVKPGYYRSDVEATLLDVFSSGIRRDGRKGFFHPDNLTFGQDVNLSEIVAEAMKVPGVAYVEMTVFQRYGKLPAGELDDGVLRVAPLEIARCDTDPNFPENGRIDFNLEGGL